MLGRAQRKPSKGKGHGIDSADSLPMTLGRPLVSPGFAGADGPVDQRQQIQPRLFPGLLIWIKVAEIGQGGDVSMGRRLQLDWLTIAGYASIVLAALALAMIAASVASPRF
jgi:hypothetical protein